MIYLVNAFFVKKYFRCCGTLEVQEDFKICINKEGKNKGFFVNN